MRPHDMPGFVTPNPKGPKSIGLWSVLFSLVLLSCSVLNLSVILAMPWIQGMLQSVDKTVQDQAQARRQASIEKLESDIKAMADPEQKKLLEEQLEATKKQPAQKGPMVGAAFKVMGEPKLRAMYLVDYGSAVVLNGMMLVSGLGLLALKEWGRKLALWTAGSKIARLTILMLVNILVMVPLMQKQFGKVIQEMSDQGQGNAGAQQFAGMFKTIMDGMQVFAWVGGSIGLMAAIAFPIIVIVVLVKPESKAACLPPEA